MALDSVVDIRSFPLLIIFLLVGQVCLGESENVDASTAEMIEKYASGMGRVAKEKLSEAGISREDADRIAEHLTNTIRECFADTVRKQSDASPSEVQAADDEIDMCVQVAFENAGITFP